MKNIPPISSHFTGYSPYGGILQELENYIQEFRKEEAAWQKDPSEANLNKLKDLAIKIRNFLEKNKAEIFAAARSMGWPPQSVGTQVGYETFVQGALTAIHDLLYESGSHYLYGVLDFLNEQITQVHWMATNKNPSP